MKNFNTILMKAERLTTKKDVGNLVVLLTEKEGEYLDKDGNKYVIPKEDDGHLYIILTNYKSK